MFCFIFTANKTYQLKTSKNPNQSTDIFIMKANFLTLLLLLSLHFTDSSCLSYVCPAKMRFSTCKHRYPKPIPNREFSLKRAAVCRKAPCSENYSKCSGCKNCCNFDHTTWGRTYCCSLFWGCPCCFWPFGGTNLFKNNFKNKKIF